MEPELALLLHTYSVVFATPINLPPRRSHDHSIPLLERSQPVKVKPYRYPHSQKEEIEKLVSGSGIAMDANKLEVVQNWVEPMKLKQLRGFLGLTSYYRRFVQSYATIAAPLIDLLKKDSFRWSQAIAQAFQQLKIAVTSALVLAIPNFNEIFVL
ncbi:uncharacterized protein LOC114371404 [Glycine soja]|uniref:uncharacterized protein LOC114371404 n=1 Tax=Glycine soja TaxID=3848 RepID=UPI001040C8DC|nr:uncharacterized protein LOC114371404 [Glycine soja]